MFPIPKIWVGIMQGTGRRHTQLTGDDLLHRLPPTPLYRFVRAFTPCPAKCHSGGSSLRRQDRLRALAVRGGTRGRGLRRCPHKRHREDALLTLPHAAGKPSLFDFGSQD
ncbi:unnamed protein product [Mycena citricolor]|uniref:Uncharacterized protein n=1 Tax=Mycena citricolor TaxID=2018698 RepID=A0AAD2GZM6_9AGAR|nr:unnamed protein product [Mycena citricolor]